MAFQADAHQAGTTLGKLKVNKTLVVGVDNSVKASDYGSGVKNVVPNGLSDPGSIIKSLGRSVQFGQVTVELVFNW